MGESEYLSGMVKYYNEARVPKEPGEAATFRAEVERDADHWARGMIDDLRQAVRGQRVLEIACGLGRWTQYMAETAAFVLATDASENLLANARGLKLPAERVEFRCVDAFDIGGVAGDFDWGVHFNFYNHLPEELAARFVTILHKRIGKGGRVFAAGQQYSERWKKQMYPKAGSRDTFSVRREEGFNFEIVDNEFDERRIREAFEDGTRDLRIGIGRAFWWASYTIC